jgi:hypothetical protein
MSSDSTGANNRLRIFVDYGSTPRLSMHKYSSRMANMLAPLPFSSVYAPAAPVSNSAAATVSQSTPFPRFSELASVSWADMMEAESNSAASTSESESAKTVAQRRLFILGREKRRDDADDETERALKSQVLAAQERLRGSERELQDHRRRVYIRRSEFELQLAKLDSASTSASASTTCNGTVTDPALITNECPITFEPLTCKTAFRLPCGHSCDRESLYTWWETTPDKRNKCPLRCEKMNNCPCSACTPAKPSCTCGRCHLVRPSFDDILSSWLNIESS